MNNYELDEKAKELAARCERLRESVNDLLGAVELDSEVDPYHPLVLDAREAMNETPAASLSIVRADAVMDALYDCQSIFNGEPMCHNEELVKYANAIRQSASKSGGSNNA